MASPFGTSRRSVRRAFALTLLTAGVGVMATVLAQTERTGTGEVVAIRELELKPGVDVAEFERFVIGTYNPAWEAAVPGARGYIARGDRGAHKGQYAFVFIFDSEKTRNAIFPKEGTGASERFLPLLERPFSANKELDRYIEPGSFSFYTDYVALR